MNRLTLRSLKNALMMLLKMVRLMLWLLPSSSRLPQ